MVRKLVFLILFLVPVSCTSRQTPLPISLTPPDTSTSTAVFSATVAPTFTSTLPPPAETPTPSATPQPRSLTVCLGAEPDTLFLYGGRMWVARNVKEAIYDGPIDSLGYDYQPVILEKLPSLADGDARIVAVLVTAGDWVVNDAGEPVPLQVGEKIRPFGCNTTDCAVVWDGTPVEMAQLSADFTLLEGILWSDGVPLTARDSIFSYQLAHKCIDPWLGYACGNLGLATQSGSDTAKRTRRYEALDDLTVRWMGMPGFMDPNYRVNFYSPLPEHALGKYQYEALLEAPEAARYPMGWGPYIIEKWEFGKQIRLRKNPNYFRRAEGLPHFDRLVFRFISENSQENIDLILAGECDLVDWDANLSDMTEELLKLDAAGLLQAYVDPEAIWEHLDFSLRHADYDDGYQVGLDHPDLFGDLRTRQAIAMCLDRERVVEQVLLGRSEVPATYLPASHPLFSQDARQYSHDVETATALLEQVGWVDQDGDAATPRTASGVSGVPDGTPLTFTYRTTTATYRQQVAAILVDSLAQCGIQASPEFAKVQDLFASAPAGDLFSRRFDMVQFAWGTGALPPCDLFLSENIPGDPEARNPDGTPIFPQGWAGQNNSGYSSPDFDRACRAARQALPEQPGYAENHRLAQQIFAQDLPVIPLFLRLRVTAGRADLCGHRGDPTTNSDTWDIEAFDYGSGCQGDD